MDVFFTTDQLSLRSRLARWVKEEVYPLGSQEDDPERQVRLFLRLLSANGFLGYTIPRAYGGRDETVQARALCLIREALAEGSALADLAFATQALGSYPITLAGSDALKQRYLPRVASGEAITAFALTEAQAGSDVVAMQSRAVKKGGEYILNGEKRFISNAGVASVYTVFAKTDPEQGPRGLSAFVIDSETPGFSVKELTRVMAPHPIGIVAFEDCRIPEDHLIGTEGQGLAIALQTLDLLRPTVGAAACGLANRALNEALHYASHRKQFGKSLAEFQAIQLKLADMATELDAARLLVYRAAWAKDQTGGEARIEASMAKLFATEAAQEIIDQALQIHGGVGVVVGSAVERLYREVRALRIYEGTSEIQRLQIAKELLRKVKREV
ncbi:MAG TPA: acyl-CoA dehydrogenase family protein [Methylomirabilota bacterium]|nr:acyl-CoA dehydrogenase family protein [Methylomirabilota bacterium]